MGRDKKAFPIIYLPRNFNPRARVGRDLIHKMISSCAAYFNPRARVGRDNPHSPRLMYAYDFNPRARVGRDGNL